MQKCGRETCVAEWPDGDVLSKRIRGSCTQKKGGGEMTPHHPKLIRRC